MTHLVQYCRYCNFLCAGNGIWCDAKKKEIAESTAKSVNHCRLFLFNPIDAFCETDGYKPRQKRLKNCAGQITMEEGADDD